jgi:hypothetical protein
MKKRSRAFDQEKPYAPGAGGLSPEEMEDFLASEDSIWILKLACNDADDWPYVVPLWYQWNGSAFRVVGRKRSVWVQHLIRDSRCAICVEETLLPPKGGNRKVLARCSAEVVEGPVVAQGSQWLAVANEMATRYIGKNGPELLSPSYAWERYLVDLTPVQGSLKTWQGTDWAPRYFDAGQRPDLEVKG